MAPSQKHKSRASVFKIFGPPVICSMKLLAIQITRDHTIWNRNKACALLTSSTFGSLGIHSSTSDFQSLKFNVDIQRCTCSNTFSINILNFQSDGSSNSVCFLNVSFHSKARVVLGHEAPELTPPHVSWLWPPACVSSPCPRDTFRCVPSLPPEAV